MIPFVPAAIELGPLTLHLYGAMYALGAAAAYFLACALARRRGGRFAELLQRGDLLADVILAAMLCGVIGGRLGYAALYAPHLLTSWEIIAVWQGGMSIHGGLALGALGVAVLAKVRRVSLLDLLDLFAAPLALGLVFGRFGNAINGELPGTPAAVPWAIDFGDGKGRHPWPLYAMAKNALLCAALCLVFLRLRPPRGVMTGLFCIGLGGLRFVAEFFRAPPPEISPDALLPRGKTLAATLAAIGGLVLVRCALRKGKK